MSLRSTFSYYAICPPQNDCSVCPFKGRAIVYGPFKSRRRGVSVGINLFPLRKVCSFNCVYCFRGETVVKTLGYVDDYIGIDSKVLLEALEEALNSLGRVEAVDFSGNGEPTLHKRFPELVKTVVEYMKNFRQKISVGVFTNSSTLGFKHVMEALQHLDYVEAKLDTVDQNVFHIVNQPVEGIKVKDIIEWLKNFRKIFSGTLSIQVMLLKYGDIVNYGEKDAKGLGEVLRVIEPDKVNIYTIYRKPRLEEVLRVDEEDIARFKSILKSYGLKVEVYPW